MRENFHLSCTELYNNSNNPCKTVGETVWLFSKAHPFIYGCGVWGLKFALMVVWGFGVCPYGSMGFGVCSRLWIETLNLMSFFTPSLWRKLILGVHYKTSNVGCRSDSLSNHILISSAKFFGSLLKMTNHWLMIFSLKLGALIHGQKKYSFLFQ